MSKKDKKIEIQIKDAKVIVNKATIEGFELLVGKKVIGQIVEIDGKFAVVDKENVSGFHKKMACFDQETVLYCFLFLRRDSEEAKRGGL